MHLSYKNIARGTTDPGIASITWLISPATKQANSVERKIQHSIGSNFDHQVALTALVPNLPTRWRHHLVTKFVPNSSYRSNAWVRCASGNIYFIKICIFWFVANRFKIWSFDAWHHFQSSKVGHQVESHCHVALECFFVIIC